VLQSFVRNIRRISVVQLGFAKLALATLHVKGATVEVQPDEAVEAALQELREITEEELEALEYFHATAELVYLTSVIDTFLSETTKFLYLLNPGSIGKNASITLDSVLRSTSKAQLVTDAAEKRARELGHLGFHARIEALRQTFGLRVALPTETIEALTKYSGIRNVLVHDQGLYEIALSDAGMVAADRPPQEVRDADVSRAMSAYRSVAYEVALAVFFQVLGAQTNGMVRQQLALFRQRADEMKEHLERSDETP
jgi:hypothetical protein